MEDLTSHGVGRNRIVADLPMANIRVRAAGQSLTIDRAEPVGAGIAPLRGDTSLAEAEKIAASEVGALHLNAAQQARLTIDLLMSGGVRTFPSEVERIAATIQQLGSEIDQGASSSSSSSAAAAAAAGAADAADAAAVNAGPAAAETGEAELIEQEASRDAAEVLVLATHALGGGGDDSGETAVVGDGADTVSFALADNLRSTAQGLHAQEQLTKKAELEQTIARLATSLGEAAAEPESRT